MLDSGVLGTYFRDPYKVIPGEQNDPNWRGWLSMSSDDLRKLSRLVAQSGWRLSVHCCGDAAMDILLDVWTDVNRAITILDKHWVLLHGQVPRPEHFTKIKALDLRVACQSVHTYTMGADFVKWWGIERASYSDPIKTYLDNGIRVGGGSDAFFCEWNPLIQIWFDVTRRSKWAGVLGPDQAITREQSIAYHTVNSALIADDDDKLGSIEPGKLADFVILSDDILACPVGQISDIRVLMTVINGDIVYQDDQYDFHVFTR
jgi:predicted amidohydrolase YtcJ